jgi:hypothetical protein
MFSNLFQFTIARQKLCRVSKSTTNHQWNQIEIQTSPDLLMMIESDPSIDLLNA